MRQSKWSLLLTAALVFIREWRRVIVRKLILLGGVTAIVTLLTASTSLGALVNGALPTAAFTYTSVTDNSVNIAGSGITLAHITRLEKLISSLSAVTKPTAAQRRALANYQALLTNYQARYDAAIDLRANNPINVKTTYSRVAPSPEFVPGWHYHNGPVIVTVTVGTFTFYDSKCGTFDLTAGHTYIESPREVLNAKALPDKNAGIATVEFFTTRLYSDEASDPVPVSPAPCTP
jgi:hypothetical protein